MKRSQLINEVISVQQLIEYYRGRAEELQREFGYEGNAMGDFYFDVVGKKLYVACTVLHMDTITNSSKEVGEDLYIVPTSVNPIPFNINHFEVSLFANDVKRALEIAGLKAHEGLLHKGKFILFRRTLPGYVTITDATGESLAVQLEIDNIDILLASANAELVTKTIDIFIVKMFDVIKIIETKLFPPYEEGLKEDKRSILKEALREAMFPKDFRRHQPGSCVIAASHATKYLLSKGVKDFEVVEGFVSLYPEDGPAWWHPHTWIEFKDGRKFDPTKKQWKQMGVDPNEVQIKKIVKRFTPEQFAKLKILGYDFKKGRLKENEKEKQVKKGILAGLTDDNISITVNHFEELPQASYVQVDAFINGQNVFSSNPDDMNKWGYPMPTTQQLMRLKTGRYRLSDIKKQLNENMSYKELLDLTAKTPRSPDDNTNRIDRSKNVNVRRLPVSMDREGKREQWNFRYKSSPQTTVTDERFQGRITFIKGEVGPDDDANELECEVDCGCPDYMYRFAANNAAAGAGAMGRDAINKAINRKPKPAYDLGEGLCKHLCALSKDLQTKITNTGKSNLFEAINDVANQGPFNIEYCDD